MVKMIVFDIDGTLVNFHQHHLSSQVIDMFKRLKAKNIYITLATGRDFVSIADIYKNEYIDFFIGANGSFIYDVKNKEYIFNSPINFNDYEKYYQDVLLNNKDVINNVVLSDSQHVYVWEKKKVNGPWFWSPFKNKFKDYELAKNKMDHNNFHLITINFDSTSNLIEQSQKYFSKTNSSLDVQAYWSTGFFVANKNINKANTIKVLAKKLAIDIQNIMAFGDGENDIQMIQEMGVGIAMGNACSILKDVANDVTKSVTENGTIYYLEKKGII